jgi:hypothetical protein
MEIIKRKLALESPYVSCIAFLLVTALSGSDI